VLTVICTGVLGLAVTDRAAAVCKAALCLLLILRMLAMCARRLDHGTAVAADDASPWH